jgi:hypothetical protein
MLVITGLRELVLVVRVRWRRSRREVRAEMQWRRVQFGGRRRQWDLRAQGVEMSENWEECGGMMLVGYRKGVRRVFGDDGEVVSLGAFVALGVTLIRGRC